MNRQDTACPLYEDIHAAVIATHRYHRLSLADETDAGDPGSRHRHREHAGEVWTPYGDGALVLAGSGAEALGSSRHGGGPRGVSDTVRGLLGVRGGEAAPRAPRPA